MVHQSSTVRNVCLAMHAQWWGVIEQALKESNHRPPFMGWLGADPSTCMHCLQRALM